MFGRTIRAGWKVLLVAPALALACTTTTDPSSLLTVSGTATEAGAAAPVTITLTAGNFSASRLFTDGTYSLTLGGGSIPASDCPSASVMAELHPPGDETTVLDEQVQGIGACGEHVVDFDFP